MSLLRSSHCLLPGLVLASAITHCAETTCDAISTCEDALDASTVPADVLVEARVQGNREAPSDAGDSASYEAGDVRLTDAVPDTSAVDASAEADVGASCGDAGACGCVDFRIRPAPLRGLRARLSRAGMPRWNVCPRVGRVGAESSALHCGRFRLPVLGERERRCLPQRNLPSP